MNFRFFTMGLLAAALAGACSSSNSGSGSGGLTNESGGGGTSMASGNGGGSNPAGGASSGGATGTQGSGGTSNGGAATSTGGTSNGGAATSTGGTPNGGSSGGTQSTGGVAGTGGTPNLGPYPAGPYGINVGDTLVDLLLQGYVNLTGDVFSNTLPWTDPYSLDDVRKSGKQYALIHVSDVICPGCQRAARDIGTRGAAITALGVYVLDILSAKAFFTATTQNDLNAWTQTANEKTSAFIDAASTPMAAMKMATVRETAIIIALPSMKVAWIDHGDISGTSADGSSIIHAEAELHTLTGK